MALFAAMNCMNCEESIERHGLDLFNTEEDIYIVILEMVGVSLDLERHWCNGFIYGAMLAPMVDVLESNERCLELIGGLVANRGILGLHVQARRIGVTALALSHVIDHRICCVVVLVIGAFQMENSRCHKIMTGTLARDRASTMRYEINVTKEDNLDDKVLA
ncbi:hypothetical protein SUGI_1195350 [Cryptomeria japonica]|nr:hypothetical protein SUGI_1195350 [Cryptomeria japonica]